MSEHTAQGGEEEKESGEVPVNAESETDKRKKLKLAAKLR